MPSGNPLIDLFAKDAGLTSGVRQRALPAERTADRAPEGRTPPRTRKNPGSRPTDDQRQTIPSDPGDASRVETDVPDQIPTGDVSPMEEGDYTARVLLTATVTHVQALLLTSLPAGITHRQGQELSRWIQRETQAFLSRYFPPATSTTPGFHPGLEGPVGLESPS